ncbi:outer membrane lipoprotein-sorting protein [Arcicella aquatica]|uniref:Outer membrane lipoprotein-sorting protein n=1 Tax=Arcicella aquatica TaxID=217141 RepID=A0ABU5QTQ7_9BACT|nr:outer membrane lipoprotein-sorting protein [Arcicella aquatica]MEA5260204.1 outer membrane lipoprotein-sorting protein [Arcicella aquatica]
MKISKIITSALIVIATTASVFAQTADEVVAKHIEAMGGLEKWKALKGLEMKNKFSVQGMDIDSKTVIVNGKSLRSDVSVMGQSIITAVDGETGWSVRPAMMGGTGEPEDMPIALVRESRKQVDLGGSLLYYKEKGSTVELVGTEKVDGADVYKLKLTEKNGDVTNLYVSTSTYYTLKTTGKRKVQGQEIEAEVSFSNFKQIDGLTFPYTMETANPMGGTMTIETESIKLNPTIDVSIFKKPASK